MQTNYYQTVLSFLKSSTDLIIEPNTKLITDSPFQAIHFPEKKIIVHCVDLDKEKLSKITPVFFSEITDVTEKHYCKTIHLWEDMWLQHNEVVRLRLLSQLGINKKIHGRLTEAITLDKKQSDDFLDNNHLQQSTNSFARLGLKFKGELMAVCTFSKSRLMTYEIENYRSYELIRFASKSGYSIAGGLSKMIAAFITEQKVEHLMTYADRDWSNGKGYKKIGFDKIENSLPQMFWINDKEMKRFYQHRLPAELMNEFNHQKKKSIEEYLSSKGYFKIYNSGSCKFILDHRKK